MEFFEEPDIFVTRKMKRHNRTYAQKVWDADLKRFEHLQDW
jgi:hypothetical protein